LVPVNKTELCPVQVYILAQWLRLHISVTFYTKNCREYEGKLSENAKH